LAARGLELGFEEGEVGYEVWFDEGGHDFVADARGDGFYEEGDWGGFDVCFSLVHFLSLHKVFEVNGKMIRELTTGNHKQQQKNH
jgi:hypothetical protein